RDRLDRREPRARSRLRRRRLLREAGRLGAAAQALARGDHAHALAAAPAPAADRRRRERARSARAGAGQAGLRAREGLLGEGRARARRGVEAGRDHPRPDDAGDERVPRGGVAAPDRVDGADPHPRVHGEGRDGRGARAVARLLGDRDERLGRREAADPRHPVARRRYDARVIGKTSAGGSSGFGVRTKSVTTPAASIARTTKRMAPAPPLLPPATSAFTGSTTWA